MRRLVPTGNQLGWCSLPMFSYCVPGNFLPDVSDAIIIETCMNIYQWIYDKLVKILQQNHRLYYFKATPFEGTVPYLVTSLSSQMSHGCFNQREITGERLSGFVLRLRAAEVWSKMARCCFPVTVPQQITVDVLSISLMFLCVINSIARFEGGEFFFLFSF